ncbi:MAG: heavy metal translocating P-type ATPase [Vicinamibacterales bacterium]
MATAIQATCRVCDIHVESTFHVDGMDCHEEVAILDKKLKALDGVEWLSADVLARRLVVAYDGAVVSSSAIASAVAETGMRAWIEHDAAAAVSHAGMDWRPWLTAISGVTLASGAGLAALGMPTAATAPVFVLAMVVGGVHTVRRAFLAARARSLDINVLMTVAVVGAIAIGQWLEGATVVFLFALAQLLESFSMERARRTLRSLMDISPREAMVRRAEGDVRVPVDEVSIGDIVVVRPGAKLPLDGEVVAGESDVNQAPVTGESLPVPKAKGARVFAGTVNGAGALEVRTTHLGRDSTVARIIHLVERAQAQRAATQAFVDRFARVYTPAILAIAFLVAVVPPLAAQAAFQPWFYRALVLLVIACPCALVISTPVSIVSALTAAARSGVLIKGGIHLERLASVRALAFDKTGTLTTGRLAVVDVTPLDHLSSQETLRLAGTLERHSEHPVGRAIVRAAFGESSSPVATPAVTACGCASHPATSEAVAAPTSGESAPRRFRALPGLGAEGEVDGRFARVGAPRLFEEAPWRRARTSATERLETTVAAHHAQGRTTVVLELDGAPAAVIALADRVRPEAREIVSALRRLGLSPLVMLTGDNEATADAQARAVGVDSHSANLLPEDKLEEVRSLKATYGSVAMVGDGVNDAPALALADVGIAMGAAGTDAALETADVALMADDLARLPFAVRLSRATLANIKTNVAIALGLKLAFLLMAIAGVATLWMAVLADTGASVIVIANALRLLRHA